MKVAYQSFQFSKKTLDTVIKANQIIDEYRGQGFILTLRQLYYQFVARGLCPNRQTEYKRLGSVVNDARLGGLIDWDSIEDRTRNLQHLSTWSSPSDILDAVATQYRVDRWETQPYRVEVWVEKEALVGVFARICDRLRVDYFACRGYVSQSELHSAAMRLKAYRKKTLVLHFGDHDPSGIDMTRDIEDRMRIFGCDVEIRRLALNMDQVREFNPPPNPAKTTDSRFAGYVREFGDESWELDALDPATLTTLVETAVEDLLDAPEWAKESDREERDRRHLTLVSENWGDIIAEYED
jgi:hypothetical protein